MNLRPCPSCSTSISPQAVACPKCGHAFKTPGGINLKDPVHIIGLALAALFLGATNFFVWLAA